MGNKVTFGVAGLWIGLALLVWWFAVPSVLSTGTFVWTSVIALGGIATLFALMRTGQQTRSMGGILYDTEHPKGGGQ